MIVVTEMENGLTFELADGCNVDDDSFADKVPNFCTPFHMDMDDIVLPGHYCLMLYKFATAMMTVRSPAQCLSVALRYIRTSLKLPAVEIVLPDPERDEASECYSTDRFEAQTPPESRAQTSSMQSIGSKIWIAHTLSDKGESKRKLVQLTSGVFSLAFRRQVMVYVADVGNDVRVEMLSDLHFDSAFPGRSMLLVPIRPNSYVQSGLLVLHLSQSTWQAQPIGLEGVICGGAERGEEYEECGAATSRSLSVRSLSVLVFPDASGITSREEWFFKLSWEMSCTLGKSLDYSHEWRDLLSSRERADGLLALMQSLYADRLGIQSSVVALTTHAKKLIRAESCTVYIVDKAHHQLWSISSDDGSQVFKPLHSCLPGRCALTGRIISSHEIDCDRSSKVSESDRQDEHYYSENSDSSEQALERESAHVTERLCEEAGSFSQSGPIEVVCMPIMSKDCSRVLAVIEAVNKNDPDIGLASFTPEDIHILEVFAR